MFSNVRLFKLKLVKAVGLFLGHSVVETHNSLEVVSHVRAVLSQLFLQNIIMKEKGFKRNKAIMLAFYADAKSYKKTMEKFGISSKGTLHYILNKR